MKQFIKVFFILVLGFFIFMASCSDDSSLPSIEGHIAITPYKTSITVKTEFTDTDNHDLYNDKVSTYVAVSSTDDDAKELARKTVSIIKQPAGEEGIDKSLEGSALDFADLSANTKYEVRLYISAGGKQKLLEKKAVTTINNGESADDPIMINNLEGLLAMNKELDAYYKLGADIDCSGRSSSLFTASTIFKGHIDGAGHTISNVVLEGNNYSGLFGYMRGATVKNLNIEGITYDNTRSDTYLGALSGYAERCVIENVNVKKVAITHSGQTTKSAWIGGLVGYAKDSTITACSVSDLNVTIGKAQLKIYLGGFVGINENSKIASCKTAGNIKVTMAYNAQENGCLYLGGFVGVNDSNLGIADCYSLVNLEVTEPESVTSNGYKTHKTYVGGFVGGNIHNISRISDCAAIGDIILQLKYPYSVYVGGFGACFNDYNRSSLTNCIYVPVKSGVVVTLWDQTLEQEQPEDEDSSTQEEKSQTAYISLGIAYISKDSLITNVIVYSNNLTITNQHAKVTVSEANVSKDISAFNQSIQDIIKSLNKE